MTEGIAHFGFDTGYIMERYATERQKYALSRTTIIAKLKKILHIYYFLFVVVISIPIVGRCLPFMRLTLNKIIIDKDITMLIGFL